MRCKFRNEKFIQDFDGRRVKEVTTESLLGTRGRTRIFTTESKMRTRGRPVRDVVPRTWLNSILNKRDEF